MQQRQWAPPHRKSAVQVALSDDLLVEDELVVLVEECCPKSEHDVGDEKHVDQVVPDQEENDQVVIL